MSHAVEASPYRPRRAAPTPGSIETATEPGRTHAGHSLVAALVGTLAVAAILLAFLWPSITTTTRHLPVVLVGSSAQEAAVQKQADVQNAGFEIAHLGSRAEAEQALKERKAYAAYVYAADGSFELLMATAASPVGAQLNGRVATGLGQDLQKSYITDQQARVKNAAALGAQAAGQAGAAKSLGAVVQQMKASMPEGTPQLVALSSQLAQTQKAAQDAAAKAKTAQDSVTSSVAPTVKVTDVVPLADGDPRGSSLATAGLPLTLGGMFGGVLVSILLRGTKSRVLGVVMYGAIAGLAIILIMHNWFDVLQGHWALEWLAAGMSLAATAALISGLQGLMGRFGMALGSTINMFIGNPMSSLSTPKEYMVGAWGEIGQMFVPGATGTLLRDLSYFPQANLTQLWLTLACWLVGGVLLSVVASAIRAHKRRSEG